MRWANKIKILLITFVGAMTLTLAACNSTKYDKKIKNTISLSKVIAPTDFDSGQSTPKNENEKITMNPTWTNVEGVALQYSTDGTTWEDVTNGTTITGIPQGTTVHFKWYIEDVTKYKWDGGVKPTTFDIKVKEYVYVVVLPKYQALIKQSFPTSPVVYIGANDAGKNAYDLAKAKWDVIDKTLTVQSPMQDIVEVTTKLNEAFANATNAILMQKTSNTLMSTKRPTIVVSGEDNHEETIWTPTKDVAGFTMQEYARRNAKTFWAVDAGSTDTYKVDLYELKTEAVNTKSIRQDDIFENLYNEQNANMKIAAPFDDSNKKQITSQLALEKIQKQQIIINATDKDKVIVNFVTSQKELYFGTKVYMPKSNNATSNSWWIERNTTLVAGKILFILHVGLHDSKGEDDAIIFLTPSKGPLTKTVIAPTDLNVRQLKLTSAQQQVTMNPTWTNVEGVSLQYSIDGTTWNDATKGIAITGIPQGATVHFRWYIDPTKYRWYDDVNPTTFDAKAKSYIVSAPQLISSKIDNITSGKINFTIKGFDSTTTKTPSSDIGRVIVESNGTSTSTIFHVIGLNDGDQPTLTFTLKNTNTNQWDGDASNPTIRSSIAIPTRSPVVAPADFNARLSIPTQKQEKITMNPTWTNVEGVALQYSTDGTTWEDVTNGTTITGIPQGITVHFKWYIEDVTKYKWDGGVNPIISNEIAKTVISAPTDLHIRSKNWENIRFSMISRWTKTPGLHLEAHYDGHVFPVGNGPYSNIRLNNKLNNILISFNWKIDSDYCWENGQEPTINYTIDQPII